MNTNRRVSDAELIHNFGFPAGTIDMLRALAYRNSTTAAERGTQTEIVYGLAQKPSEPRG